MPHFHAIYGEFNGVFDLDTLEMIEGYLPHRAQRLVSDWAEPYKDDLLRMWKTQVYRKLPGLERTMRATTTYLRIRSVTPTGGKTLLVTFENETQKLYDCSPLLQLDAFRPLEDEALFRCAHADSHGYGVVWNDDIDLAESEVWINGQTAEQPLQRTRTSRTDESFGSTLTATTAKGIDDGQA